MNSLRLTLSLLGLAGLPALPESERGYFDDDN